MAFNFTSWWSTTETDVVNLLAKVKADVAVAQKDIDAAVKWIASQTPTIVADLQIALKIAQMFGVVTAPEIVAANAAVAALNAFATAQSAGKTDIQSVATGYVAYTQAAAAVNSAKASSTESALK